MFSDSILDNENKFVVVIEGECASFCRGTEVYLDCKTEI
jgi:hypothetical protein